MVNYLLVSTSEYKLRKCFQAWKQIEKKKIISNCRDN